MWIFACLAVLVFSSSVTSLPAEIQQEVDRLLYTECPSDSNELCICAFNIQTFGKSKMEDPEVVEILVKIISRYDIVLIQEIRDVDEVAIWDLLDYCNAIRPGDDQLNMVMSARLGRSSSYKEQYAYYYRESRLSVDDTYQYPNDEVPPSDEASDTTGFYDEFERPPYAALFSRTGSGQLRQFGFIGSHVKPDDAPEEIDSLVDVYDEVVDYWNLDDMIIGGDLNAGCSYFGDSDKETNRLYNDPRFTWLIGDDANTNVASSECPYDRFIIGGNDIHNAYVADSAQVYYYDEWMGIDDEDLVKDVSDHYPIEMRVD